MSRRGRRPPGASPLVAVPAARLAPSSGASAERGLPWPRHPFTLPVLALAVLVLVFVLPAPGGPASVAAATVGAAAMLGEFRALRRGLLAALVPSLLLLVLHGGFGGGAPVHVLDGVMLSAPGLRVAAAQAARLVAVLVASALVLARFQPSRFIDAVAARGWRPHWAYLVVATLQAVPRLVLRARQVADAQSTRGLARRGSLARRVRALAPLALPLVLGTIVEADDRAQALEQRGLGGRSPRTPLLPPPDPPGEMLVRALAVLAAVGAVAWRVSR